MIGTPTEAAQWACPQSRAFSEPRSKCRGPECAWWRWQPLDVTTDPRWAKAVAAEVETLNDEREAEGKKRVSPHLLHQPAVARVMKRRDELDLPTKPTHGYCGAAGEPKA